MDMTPQEKIDDITTQILDIRAGHTKSMLCPYCGAMRHVGCVEICCELMARAIKAICDRLDSKDTADFMAEITERHLGN